MLLYNYPHICREANNHLSKFRRIKLQWKCEALNIRCEAIAKPEPDVRWIHHGQVKSYGNKTAELTFKTITKSDAGVYTCRANNSAGTAEKKSRLAIKCKYIHCSTTHHFLFILDLLFICYNYFCKKKKSTLVEDCLTTLILQPENIML